MVNDGKADSLHEKEVVEAVSLGNKLGFRFSLYFLLMISVILLVIAAFIISYNTVIIENDLVVRNKVISSKISDELNEHLAGFYYFQFDRFTEVVNAKFDEYDDIVHIRIINTEGKILFDSEELAEGKYNGTTERFVTDEKLLKNVKSTGVYQDFVTYDGRRTLRIIAPYIDRYGVHKSAVEILYGLDELYSETRAVEIFFITIFGLSILVSVLLTTLLIRRITGPITALTKGAREIYSGNMKVNVEVKSRNELGILSATFNKMVEMLEKSRKDIEEYNRTLEKKVKERTKEIEVKKQEIEKANKELERFNKLAVGRELKMVEMKKKMRSLEAKAESDVNNDK